jgi:hypothetical protein
MSTIARAFRVTSKKDVREFAKDIDAWPAEAKTKFRSFFGNGQERWYYQKIGGVPYVISVAEFERAEGWDEFAKSDDEFMKWFRKRVKALTGVSLKKTPKGPPAELVYELNP